jgi:ABC-type lipoprotein release transport system permease subunit
MRFSNFSYMVASNLAEKKWRTALAVLVIAFAVAVALAVTATSSGMLRGLQARAADMFPPTVLMVKPKTVALAMLAFNSATINEESVTKIKALDGVGRVEPQLSLRVPLRMEIEIAGQYAVTDAVVIGVEPSSLQADMKTIAPFTYDDASSQPVPCLVPKMLLDMYNLAYAESVGFPKINEEFLLGKKFTMNLGETYLAGGGGGKSEKLLCQVVGLVSDASLVPGVYMPMEYATRINEWYTGKSEQPFTALRVIIDRPDQVNAIKKSLSDMGLMVEGNQWAYESITFAAKAGAILLYVFAFLILLVASFSILNLFSLIMAHRTGEMRLLNAVGATRTNLRWMYFTEAAAIAVTGILLGGVTIYLLLKTVESYIQRRLKVMEMDDLSVLPEEFFAFDLLPVAIVVIVVLIMSVAAPLIITWRTTGRQIAGSGQSYTS